MSSSTAKERIHQLIDQITDEQAEEIELMIKLALIPEDDEPLMDEELEALEEARAQVNRGHTIPADEAKRQLLQ